MSIVRVIRVFLLLCIGSTFAFGSIIEAEGSFGGNFYRMYAFEPSDAGVTWDDASAITMALSYNGQLGHLATVQSHDENDFIDTLRYDTTANVTGASGGLDSEFWLGGYVENGNWMWVAGHGSFPADNNGPEYANWNVLEPNNLGGSEDHLTIGRYGDDTWNDEGYWLPNIHGFVVEFEGAAVPEPSPFSCLAMVGVGFFVVRKWRQRKMAV